MGSKNKDKHIKQLEKIIQKFLHPVREIPFHIAIKGLYNKEVISIDPQSKQDKKLIKVLSAAAKLGGKQAKKDGIFRKRPNEVGNDMENYVKDALNKLGLKAQIPKTKNGKKRSTGYPDLYLKDGENKNVYLEIKTYNKENIETTQRSFYFSPPPKSSPKIIYDALHLVLSFEIKQTTRKNKRCYYPDAWKLLDIYELPIDIKHEFNSTNERLYKKKNILNQGKIK